MKGEFYKMEFRAWNIGTVDLTLEQEAAYLRLCHAMYDIGGPVPNSPRMLMGLFRCGNVKAAALLKALISAGKIAQTKDGKLINHRVTEELADRERVSSARRVAGERGGSAPRVKPEWTPSDPRVNSEWTPSDAEVNGAKPLQNKDAGQAIAPTPQSRGEEIREEKKIDKNPQDTNVSSAPKGARARGTRIPENFVSSEEARAVCEEMGLAGAEAVEALAEFRDFWVGVPGVKGTKLDWPATLRNRLRDVGRRRPRQALPLTKQGRDNPYHTIHNQSVEDLYGQSSDAAAFRPRLIAGSRH